MPPKRASTNSAASTPSRASATSIATPTKAKPDLGSLEVTPSRMTAAYATPPKTVAGKKRSAVSTASKGEVHLYQRKLTDALFGAKKPRLEEDLDVRQAEALVVPEEDEDIED